MSCDKGVFALLITANSGRGSNVDLFEVGISLLALQSTRRCLSKVGQHNGCPERKPRRGKQRELDVFRVSN
eukprot:684200-Amphidinium_carterae.1